MPVEWAYCNYRRHSSTTVQVYNQATCNQAQVYNRQPSDQDSQVAIQWLGMPAVGFYKNLD
jgi:hypothetical protein